MGEDDGSEFRRNANYHVGVSLLNGGTPKTRQNDQF